jgi:predicted nucleotidyltransferase component of viral defense system
VISDAYISGLANKLQTTELNCRREYFQHVFLSHFYRQPQASDFYFKGGTALRLIYNSPRFSEDLDFSTSLHDYTAIEQTLLQTQEALQTEGIDTNLEEAKQTSGGYLARIAFAGFTQSITILLQIALRQHDKQGENVVVVNDFIPSYLAVRLKQEQLIDEKLQALLERRKPRDFYDLYFILRANLLPTHKRSILPHTLAALRASDINFETELKLFLPKSQWLLIKDFERTLAQEIERFL